MKILLIGDQVVTRAPWIGGFLPAYVETVNPDGTYGLRIAQVGTAKGTLVAGALFSNVQRASIWTREDVKVGGIPK